MTTIPVLVGTLAFISPNQTNAANPSDQIAQATDAPNPPDGQHKPPKINFAAAANLGVTEAQLKDTLLSACKSSKSVRQKSASAST